MHEPSDEKILQEHGGLLWAAISAFGTDPAYFADMSESANLIEYKRRMWEARTDAQRSCSTPDEVKELTTRLMAERGIVPPNGRRRRAA